VLDRQVDTEVEKETAKVSEPKIPTPCARNRELFWKRSSKAPGFFRLQSRLGEATRAWLGTTDSLGLCFGKALPVTFCLASSS
jgi:hypothetical protein